MVLGFQNQTNSDKYRHLVLSIFKRKQENDGVGEFRLYSKHIVKPLD